MARIQNTPGSLLNKIGIACGIPDLTPTMLRQAAENQVQKNSKMKENSKLITMHSEDVGRHIYHKSGPQIRAEFGNFMDVNVDSPTKKVKVTDNDDKQREEKMQELEEADAEARKLNAKEYLTAERKRRDRSLPTGKRRRVNSLDKEFLLELVFNEVFQSTYQNFPDGKTLSLKC